MPTPEPSRAPEVPPAGRTRPGDRVLARRQVRDTARLERIAVQAGQLIGGRMQRAAVAGLRQGRDLAAAMQGQFDAARELLVDLMVVAHLEGRRRTLVNAAAHLKDRPVPGGGLRMGVFDEAKQFLQDRLQVSHQELAALRMQYGQEALRVTGALQASVERKLLESVAQVTAAGEHKREAIKALREGFARAGVAPDNSFTFEAVFRTQTQLAYGAGRWNSLRNDPAVDAILWGFRYSTVGDDRVRPEHAMLEGTTLPKDDPFWQTHWPPNGWACRCVALEVFHGDEPDEPVRPLEEIEIDGVTYRSEPQAGFGFNPGEVFRDQHVTRPAGPPRPISEVRIVSTHPLGGGINETVRVELEDGRSAVRKLNAGQRQMIDEQPESITSPAVYEIDRAMEIGLVPETRPIPGGSLQLFVDDAVLGRERMPSEAEQQKLAVFDYIVGNWDRHNGNVMSLPDGRAVAIDNGYSLPLTRDIEAWMKNDVLRLGGAPVTEEIAGYAQRLLDKRQEVERALTQLGVDRARIVHVLHRARDVLRNQGRTLVIDNATGSPVFR